MNPGNKHYPDVNPQAKFPEIEERILAYWQKHSTFQESIDFRPAGTNGSNEFVFYDGPPFANGLPHYGHLLTGFVKDVFPRYQTMRGKRVERRFGWDCHGLPPEMEAEKELKISGRAQIQQFGIDKFNAHCRSSVLRYTREWENYVTRQARWVDFRRDYKTMDLSYMESVIWAFSELWKKGLVYEGTRVMPYSWACETPLSNFEIRMDNATRPRQDPAVTVLLKLKPVSSDQGTLNMLVWTTTPWTLPSNLALAVGSDIDYALMQEGSNTYVIAESAIERYEQQLSQAKKVGSLKGSQLVGRSYEPLFPYFSQHPKSFVVLSGDFVNTEEGTGVVHMAPGFGEDDQKLCEKHGIDVVCPVDVRGCFTAEVPDYAGKQVFDANKEVIADLKKRKVLIKHESYTHNYPHCWRTDTPIIYKAVNSFYVRVTEFRDRMVQLNQQINWIPAHVKDGQFGKWLANARDWSISRNRFWGAPIPVWKSDDPRYPRVDVYGSLAELERDFGVKISDLHRPGIDNLVRPNPDDPTGKSKMRRVEEVLDCWFESGSMPFAQMHYPFENKAWFEHHFPADFIVEYVAQTRGWFYTLMVLATALFDKPPFKNCVCHGVVLDENGQKLSKRLRNYPSPEEVCNTFGADALRWFLISSPILRGQDLQIDRDGKGIAECVRTVINPIWNSYYFFTLYANADGVRATFSTSSKQLLDRYILSKTGELIQKLQTSMDQYELDASCQHVLHFLEALNNWYIRRSRDRFWKHERDQDKQDAYNTLYTVLCTLTKVAAPLLPLISEEVYRGLTGEKSVHLCDWPNAKDFPAAADLVYEMDRVRDVCSSALSLRESHNLRTRLPLKRLTVAGKDAERLRSYAALIRDEINVKEVEFTGDVANFATFQLQLNARELGPKLGGRMKDVLSAAKQGTWKRLPDGRVEVAGQTLETGEFSMRLLSREGIASQGLSTNDAVAVLDVKVTPDLEEEGLARDLVRLVQQSRKEAGLHIADRIELSVSVPVELERVLRKHEGYVSDQTLAKVINYGTTGNRDFEQKSTLDGKEVTIALSKAR
ncbi:MAG: isoleucine--tRNA ligase [Oligoflexia bacterium]|nr:isoleucine--tRNA ligase [Oligoflexia bacterium]